MTSQNTISPNVLPQHQKPQQEMLESPESHSRGSSCSKAQRAPKKNSWALMCQARGISEEGGDAEALVSLRTVGKMPGEGWAERGSGKS